MYPMPDTTSDAFLQGQGIPVDPHQIDTELTKLWGPAAERVGGPEVEHPTVTRVVLANLVVGSKLADAARIDGTLDTVVQRYPCRAIVLRQTDEPGREVKAEVSALCHLPAPGMPQVCSERIVLRAGRQALDLLPGAVRSLLEADLPFVLWWTRDPREAEALYVDLADECSRLILDVPDPDTEPAALRIGLDLNTCPYARDIAWFGITRWRELVAQFFDCADREALNELVSVSIAARAPSGVRPPRVAAWLAAWLAGQLSWQPQNRQETGPGRVEATFKRPAGTIAVSIDTEVVGNSEFGHLTGVTLRASGPDGERMYRLTRPSGDSPQVRIEVDSPSACTLPRTVLAPTFDAPRRVAAALESSRSDPPYRRALPHMLWLLGDNDER
jgi:glucose-6-phosphate dehydrogenase assembly protein OpcA